LQSVLREALIVATGPTLLPEFLALSTPLSPAEVERPETVTLPRVGDWNKLEKYLEEGLKDRHPDLYRGLIQRFDAIVLGQVMQAVGGLQSRAAEALGLSRPTLRAKLRLISRGLSGNNSDADAAKLS
jgi:DNA-binding protein Fis